LCASTISAREQIPEVFLRLILLELKNKGLVHNKRGRGGGYTLARKPSLITIGQSVRALDGPMLLLACTNPAAPESCNECVDRDGCGIRAIFKEASEATDSILDRTTLADIAGLHSRLKIAGA